MRGHQSAYRLNQRRTERRAFFIQAALGFPLNTPPPRDERSLTVRGPVRGSPRRARSFGDCLSSRAGSAVPRDGSRRFIRLNWALSLAFYADSCNQKINASNRNGRIRPTDAPVSHTRYFRFSPKIPLPTRHAHSPFATAQGAAVKERGHLTAALSSRAGSAVPRDIFCSALALRRGSGRALSKSFAFFCASRNARVPLRYASQPFRRKIYTKSFAQCFVITFI